MTRLYDLAYRLSGCLAGVCAVLALLATPSSARADDIQACANCCTGKGLSGPEYSACVGDCMNRIGPCGDVSKASSCPGAPAVSCHVNDGAETSCGGITCMNDKNFCDCKYDKTTTKCNCP